jgi:translation initiation factor IF-1
MRTKCRYLSSHVLPSLLYAAECGNHKQKQYKEFAVFLNTCRRQLLGKVRFSGVRRKVRLEVLRRRCKIPLVLSLPEPRQLAFMSRVLVKPSSALARQMFFARVAPGQGQKGRISGRAKSSYVATLGTDLEVFVLWEVDPTTASLDTLWGWPG